MPGHHPVRNCPHVDLPRNIGPLYEAEARYMHLECKLLVALVDTRQQIQRNFMNGCDWSNASYRWCAHPLAQVLVILRSSASFDTRLPGVSLDYDRADKHIQGMAYACASSSIQGEEPSDTCIRKTCIGAANCKVSLHATM